jgi:hypothetical protein
MTELTTAAKEEGTYVITVSFTDEDGDPVSPTAITWTLSDYSGNVVNSRQNEVFDVSGLDKTYSGSTLTKVSADIVLSGADLALPSPSFTKRVLTVKATYSSDAGSGLPLRDQIGFSIENLVAIQS